MIATLRARMKQLAERRPTGDAGTTMMELIVGMVIMTIFMAMFTTAIVLMTSTANKVEAVTISSTQSSQAFIKLDKLVRYAAAVTTPGASATSGDWYVELDTSASVASTGLETCTQLRVDKTAQALQLRTWTISGGTAAAASSWTQMASNITNGNAASTATSTSSPPAPFTVPTVAGGASSTYQRLQVTLVATAGTTSTGTTYSQVSFTALNSSASASSNNTVCQQWGRP
jgi:hypothetical protein